MLTFEFDQELDRKYYEEMYFIACNYNKFVKNPHRRVSSPMINFILVIIVILIAMIGCFLILNEPQFAIFKTVITTVYAVCIFFYGCFAFNFCHSVKKMQKSQGKRYFTISETSLEMKGEGKDISMELNQISAFRINKNSLCFLPKDSKGVIFGLPVSCKDEIVNYLRKIGKDNIIVNK